MNTAKNIYQEVRTLPKKHKTIRGLALLFIIAVLVIEFGISQQLLRGIGKEPEQALLIMGRVFLAKR
jgi:hypothetical protein